MYEIYSIQRFYGRKNLINNNFTDCELSLFDLILDKGVVIGKSGHVSGN